MRDAPAPLAGLLGQARRIAIFTGAGISTESGVPDFRSPGGIWSRLQPIKFQDFVASADQRREAWRRKIEIDRDMLAAQPNRGHRAVAALVASGLAPAVITQNIDGLHQRSGIAEGAVIELHGNATYAKCLACGMRYELAPIIQAFTQERRLPTCEKCGGLVKSATISFGQSMPEDAMRRAHAQTLACDLFLVLGSSLVVFPAADFPRLAKNNGAKLVIINREETPQDPLADLVLHTELGPTLGAALGVA
ncbi:MAG: NAD-dependent deacetylase [Gammaproteobacteria bacterium]|nr:NAD-dependent deacetylase [Gammaproteobacteria bacterium]